MTKLVTGAALFALFGVHSVANASLGFRCGAQIIDVGDSEVTLLEHCGEPTSREGY